MEITGNIAERMLNIHIRKLFVYFVKYSLLAVM